MLISTGLTVFGVLFAAGLWLITRPRQGLLMDIPYVAGGVWAFWAARNRRASYVQVYDHGFAVMKKAGVPRDIVRWSDITDVKPRVDQTVSNGILTDCEYICTVYAARRKDPVTLSDKRFKSARAPGQEIQLEHSRRRGR